MYNNVVHQSDNPPGYSEQPPAAGPSSSAPYGQSTLLHDGGKQTQPAPPPQPAWNDPPVNQYPPAGYAQYPPQTAPGPYGQPMAAPYPQPGYGTQYYGGAPAPPPQQPQQQQQQQVVIVGAAQPYPVVIQTQSFMGQMLLACFVMWCCNFLFGLVAFILAGKWNRLLSVVSLKFAVTPLRH